MVHFKLSAAGLGLLVLSMPMFADSWAPPRPRIFANQWGSHGLKVLKPKFGGKAQGVLFTLDKTGKSKVMWKHMLVNTPNRVFVSDSGKHVVTVDTYGRVGYTHSLVVYGPKGKVVCDLRLEDLLTAAEIKTKVTHSVASRWWSMNAQFSFKRSKEGSQFVIRLKWGKEIRINLKNGKVAS